MALELEGVTVGFEYKMGKESPKGTVHVRDIARSQGTRVEVTG